MGRRFSRRGSLDGLRIAFVGDLSYQRSTNSLAYLLSPLICILLITLALVTLANAVDEFFNPRLRRV